MTSDFKAVHGRCWPVRADLRRPTDGPGSGPSASDALRADGQLSHPLSCLGPQRLQRTLLRLRATYPVRRNLTTYHPSTGRGVR